MHDDQASRRGTDEVDPHWYRDAFGALYPVLYAHRTVESAGPEARMAAEELALSGRENLLDLACGNGRHLVHLCQHAVCSVGLDYSPELLALAAQNLRPGPAVLLTRGDMRAIPFYEVFDAVTSFFTSFGYFSSDEENGQVAKEVARVLRPGGRFFVDYLNREWVAATLEPESVRSEQGYVIAETRWIDAEMRRVNKCIEVSRDGQAVTELAESVRLYTQEELTGLLAAAGLRVDRVYGGYGREPFGSASPRMILIGKKA